MFRFDTMLLGGNGLGTRDKVSVKVFHRRPSTCTVVLLSMDLSVVAVCCKVVLLVTHDRRLKFT